MPGPDSAPRLDEIDRRVLHALMRDARNTSAAAIAEEVNVSGATVRNLHVLAVGEDTGDLRRIARRLSALGIDIVTVLSRGDADPDALDVFRDASAVPERR